MLFKNITGKKEGKTFNEPVVFASPTTGEFRITPKVQKILDIEDGDFMLTVVGPKDEQGNDTVFIGKGRKGVQLVDENGEPLRNKIGKFLYEEGTGFGAVARKSSERSPLLKFSGSAGWHALGCDNDSTSTYTLGEPIEGQTETGNGDELFDGIFYQLVFKGKKAKVQRATSSTEEDVDDDDDFADEIETVEEV